MAKRMAGNPRFPDKVRAAYAGKSAPVLIEKRLDEPSRLRKPARIGVQFMGDLFHKNVSTGNIQQVFDLMSQTPQHTYLILTKRPHRMKMFFVNNTDVNGYLHTWDGRKAKLPLPNVWGLVSAENQKQADLRIPLLLQCQFAVRGVSIEPMLGAVNVAPFLPCGTCNNSGIIGHSCDSSEDCPDCHGYSYYQGLEGSFLDYVIAGAETGPGARTMDPDWARGVRDQCKEAGVPFFFKQMSNKETIPDDLMVREWPGGAG